MTQVPINQSANPNQFGAAIGEDKREQEKEWEKEGFLDPAWEKQQKKVQQSSPFHLHFQSLLYRAG